MNTNEEKKMPPGFIIYHKDLRQALKLNDDQLRWLLKSLLEFSENGVIPEETGDLAKDICASIMIDAIERYHKKYDEKCKKNSLNAQMRWAQQNAIACGRMQSDATDANINPNPNLYINQNKNKLEGNKTTANPHAKQNPQKTLTNTNICTLEQVITYFAEKGKTQTEAERFFYYHQQKGWETGKNKQKIKDWKAAANYWITTEKKYTENAENKNKQSNEYTNENGIGWKPQ